MFCADTLVLLADLQTSCPIQKLERGTRLAHGFTVLYVVCIKTRRPTRVCEAEDHIKVEARSKIRAPGGEEWEIASDRAFPLVEHPSHLYTLVLNRGHYVCGPEFEYACLNIDYDLAIIERVVAECSDPVTGFVELT